MNHILCPVDFSQNAISALRYALDIAIQTKAKLTLLHVQQEKPSQIREFFDKNALQLLLNADYSEVFTLFLEAANNRDDYDIDIFYKLDSGKLTECIAACCKENDTNLVVMGTRGISGLKELFLGSNTSIVVEEVNIPVLVVPEKANFHQLKKIAFATDFKSFDEDAFKYVLAFVRVLDAPLHCFHINIAHHPLLKDKKTALEQKYADFPVTFEIVDANFVTEGINKYIFENKVDLLTIQTHKYTFLERLFYDSYTEKLVLHTDVPLLTFK